MRCGLGAADREADLVFDDGMAGGASADPSVGGQILGATGRHLQHARIAVRTVDAVVAPAGAPPDFLKIDVEGMEIAVLHGAEQVLRNCPGASSCGGDDVPVDHTTAPTAA